jgi:hypothetical protein
MPSIGSSVFSSKLRIIKPPNPTPITNVGNLYSFAIFIHSTEKTELPIEGILLLSPMLEFKKNYKTRKNMFISNIGKSSKDTQFKLGIDYEDLTRNSEVIDETNHDGLMLKKVSYKWFNIISFKISIEDVSKILSSVPYINKVGNGLISLICCDVSLIVSLI